MKKGASTVKMMIRLIRGSDDGRKLRALAKKLSPEKLRRPLEEAARLGADSSIQVLAQCGAKVTREIVSLAKQPSPKKGYGEHIFAALYLEALMERRVSPRTPLHRLRIVERRG